MNKLNVIKEPFVWSVGSGTGMLTRTGQPQTSFGNFQIILHAQ